VPFAELHCLSNFSFLRGASHPDELVERARALGYAALAITDECSLAGAVQAHQAAKRCGLALILGAQFELEDGLRVVLLAADREGWGNLSQLITDARRAAPKGGYRLARAGLEGGVPGCLALWLPPREPPREPLDWLAARFPGRLWIAVELLLQADDAAHLAALVALGAQTGVPLVAANDVHMHVRERRALADTLTAIRLKRPLAECGYALHPNGERHLRPLDTLRRIYPPELLAESVRVAQRCRFGLDELRYEYPQELVPQGETPASWLRGLTEEGFRRRFAQAPAETDLARVRAQIEHELALIGAMRVEAFFLTVHDIVRFARSRGILCQGRGSAANSAVCYCLGITEVDPARMDILFERFISKERNEPPDIDVDFEHQRREEVMQYIYAKYGRERAGLTATTICYRPRSALRDVGKALGLEIARVERLAKSMAWWDGRKVVPQRLAEAGFDPESALMRRLAALVDELIGFPRHLSQHTGGFVISQGPLSRLVPIENAAMPERTVIQWNKDDLDALGLLKVDVLALGMLSAIRRALEMVSRRRGVPFGIADVPKEDPAVYDMIGRADTIGVFQIESRAQMSMLPRLKPRSFYDLVIEVAIVRPGPIQGGMVHPYLRRRQGLEPVDYPSEAVRRVLARTLGVPIFQEQAMRLAVVAAGFTPGEADQLRRSMAAWRRRGGLEGFERKLVDGMLARGYTQAFADRLFRQIMGFGEYGFPESHAASFALLVYVSAWLKCHEPAAFTCALLNSQPMGFYAPSQLIQDARRDGVELRPADVQASEWECTLEDLTPDPSPRGGEGGSALPSPACGRRVGDEGQGERCDEDYQPALRLGLCMVKGLSRAGAQRLVQARGARPFDSAADLAQRAALDRRDLEALAAAGALAGLSGHRRAALWDVCGIERAPGLLREAPVHERRAALVAPDEGADLVADYASLGLTLGRHPLALLREELARQRMLTASAIGVQPHGRIVRVTGLVTGRQRPATASGATFVTLEDETGSVNVIVWRTLAERQRRELIGASLLTVYGRLEREGEVVHVVAGRLRDQSALLGSLTARSRDFR
jgi:error-prone DNA polymerase